MTFLSGFIEPSSIWMFFAAEELASIFPPCGRGWAERFEVDDDSRLTVR